MRFLTLTFRDKNFSTKNLLVVFLPPPLRPSVQDTIFPPPSGLTYSLRESTMNGGGGGGPDKYLSKSMNIAQLNTKIKIVYYTWCPNKLLSCLTLDSIFICRSHRVFSARLSIQSSELGPPTPTPAICRVLLPPLDPRGETDSLTGEEVGDPIPTIKQTLWYSRYTIIPLR